MAIHAYDERGTRGDGPQAIKELQEKYLRVTDETARALQATLAATTMGPDEDPDHYVVKAKRLLNRLTAVKEPVTYYYSGTSTTSLSKDVRRNTEISS